jgi:hypothetical protein
MIEIIFEQSTPGLFLIQTGDDLMDFASYVHKHRRILAFAGLAVLAGGAILYPWISDSHRTTASGEVHQGHTGHGSADLPAEAGQSAFAAIAEIVAILNADPDTDWASVNIGALREHLVDMDRLMLAATAQQQAGDDTVIFTVSGDGDVLRAIHAMVPPHARELAKLESWTVNAETTPDGAILQIKVARPADLARIKGLGFFGLMATGAHHQPHHLAMAKGDMGSH